MTELFSVYMKDNERSYGPLTAEQVERFKTEQGEENIVVTPLTAPKPENQSFPAHASIVSEKRKG